MKLSSVCKIISGGTPKTSEEKYWNGSIPWISIKDFIQSNRFIYSTEKSITELGLNNSATNLLQENDIILSARGTVGECALLKYPMAFNQSCYGLRANNTDLLQMYLFYWLKSNKTIIQSGTHGAVFDTITRSDFDRLEINLPTITEQQHIVDTIGTVDDLIEKYQEIDAEIMKLLSMKFESIKHKNNCVRLEDFAFYQEGPGIRNWQYVDSDGVKFINIRCINDNDMQLEDANMISKEEAYGIYKHFMVQEDDILVSTSGTLGRLAIARKEHLPLCMNTSVIRFRPLIKKNYPYLFCFLMSDEFKNLIISMANGSAQLNFGPTHIKKINLFLPNENELNDFNNFSQPLINKHKMLLRNIDKLKRIKTLLLNKYFS